MMPITPRGKRTRSTRRPLGRTQPSTTSPTGSGRAATSRRPAAMPATRPASRRSRSSEVASAPAAVGPVHVDGVGLQDRRRRALLDEVGRHAQGVVPGRPRTRRPGRATPPWRDDPGRPAGWGRPEARSKRSGRPGRPVRPPVPTAIRPRPTAHSSQLVAHMFPFPRRPTDARWTVLWRGMAANCHHQYRHHPGTSVPRSANSPSSVANEAKMIDGAIRLLVRPRGRRDHERGGRRRIADPAELRHPVLR